MFGQTVLVFLFIHYTFLIFIWSSPTPNICSKVTDKFTERRTFNGVQTWLLIKTPTVLCPRLTSAAALGRTAFTTPTVCFTYCMAEAVFRVHPSTYRHESSESAVLDSCTLDDQEFLSRLNTQTILDPAGVGAGVQCVCM